MSVLNKVEVDLIIAYNILMSRNSKFWGTTMHKSTMLSAYIPLLPLYSDMCIIIVRGFVHEQLNIIIIMDCTACM